MAPHPFDAVEFQLAGIEFGRLHRDGRLEVPFVRSVRNALVADGAADIHPWVPNSGWTAFFVENDETAAHAVFLLELAFLYRAATNPGLGVPASWLRETLHELKLTGRLSEVFDDLMAAVEA